jgi:hypothetical protein
MKRVIGGSKILNTELKAGDALELELSTLYGSTCPMGPSRLSGRLY